MGIDASEKELFPGVQGESHLFKIPSLYHNSVILSRICEKNLSRVAGSSFFIYTICVQKSSFMAENNEKMTKKPNRSYAMESAKVMSVAFELGFVIALPIVALASLGKWLDHRQGTGYFVYIGIVLAMLVTIAIIYSRFNSLVNTLKEAARLKNEETQKENTK
jgi:hypothetical protein